MKNLTAFVALIMLLVTGCSLSGLKYVTVNDIKISIPKGAYKEFSKCTKILKKGIAKTDGINEMEKEGLEITLKKAIMITELYKQGVSSKKATSLVFWQYFTEMTGNASYNSEDIFYKKVDKYTKEIRTEEEKTRLNFYIQYMITTIGNVAEIGIAKPQGVFSIFELENQFKIKFKIPMRKQHYDYYQESIAKGKNIPVNVLKD